MRFRRDRRGAAIQVGAVLLLGFLVIALSLYQVNVVPEENKRVEFRHNQEVQNDMVDVRNALQRAGTTEDVQPTSVEMGTTYPARVIFVNPPPPGGVIRNGSEQTATFSNISATNNETADFLNSSAKDDLDTKNLSYRPSYNVYQSAPTTTYQSGVLVNEFERGNDTAVTDQALIRGNEIYFVAVAGNVSQGQTRAYTVNPQSLSTSVEATTVSNESGRINVTVPTTLTEKRWRTLLEDEGKVKSVSKQNGRVSILLTNGTYRLRTALVGVGTGAEAPGPAYLTRVGARNVTPLQDEELTVELRDKYNNPVDPSTIGGPVYVNVTSDNRYLVETNRTRIESDGRAQFTYVGNGTSFEGDQLTLSVEGKSAPRWNVTFNITDRVTTNGGGTGPNGGNAGNVTVDQVQINNGDIVVKFRNGNAQQVTFDRVRLDGYSEANVPGGPDEIDRVIYDSGPTLDESGGFQSVTGPTISNGGNQDVTFDPRRFNSNSGKYQDAAAESGDSMTITVEFSDGSTKQYTINL